MGPAKSHAQLISVICTDDGSSLWSRASNHFDGQSEFLLVRCPADARDVLSLCDRLGPGVLLTTPNVFHRLPASELNHMTASGRLQILIVCTGNDSVEEYLRLGCMGMLHHDSPAVFFRKAVQTVAGGEMWAPRSVLSRLARQALATGTTRTLTKRETEIMDLIARGYKNRDIATELYISRETVRWHVRSLYAKLGVSDRQSAIDMSIKGKVGVLDRDLGSVR